MAVSLSKRTARHAACDHDDYRLTGWPQYCDQCSDPVTITYWPSLTSDIYIRVMPGTYVTHRASVAA